MPFVDPTLPAGYAPFGIQALNTGAAGATQIYVTYAQQNGTDNHDQTNGAGLGLVDIFDTNGVFVSHLVATGWAAERTLGCRAGAGRFRHA